MLSLLKLMTLETVSEVRFSFKQLQQEKFNLKELQTGNNLSQTKNLFDEKRNNRLTCWI